VIRFWALIAEDTNRLISRLTTDDAITLAGGFIPAFITEPVTIWDVIHGWSETIGVVAFVTAVA
jgi:hypothetical protein